MARALERSSSQLSRLRAASSRRLPNSVVAYRKAPRNCTSLSAARALASKVAVVK